MVFCAEIEIVSVPLCKNIYNIIKAFIYLMTLNVFWLQYRLYKFVAFSFYLCFSGIWNLGF